HLALPVVDEDPHLRALQPFRSAISSGVKAIMSAHIVATAIDRAPATISRRIMTALLRDELGFKGIAITDGLEMRGLSDGVGMTAALWTQGVRVSAFDVDAEGGAHSLEAPLRVAAGKSLVAVVRDLHRRLAQREAIDSLLGSRPDAVVVEMGLPLCRPGGAM